MGRREGGRQGRDNLFTNFLELWQSSGGGLQNTVSFVKMHTIHTCTYRTCTHIYTCMHTYCTQERILTNARMLTCGPESP